MGGFDFRGLDYAIAYYGVTDVGGLLDRLIVLRSHDPKANEMPAPLKQEDDDDEDFR